MGSCELQILTDHLYQIISIMHHSCERVAYLLGLDVTSYVISLEDSLVTLYVMHVRMSQLTMTCINMLYALPYTLQPK